MIGTSGKASGERQETPELRPEPEASGTQQTLQPERVELGRTIEQASGMPQAVPGISLSSQLRARPGQYFAYSGRTLLVTGVDGMIRGAGCAGFYFENTRLLSRYELRVNG